MNSFNLGETKIGNFKIWIADPVFTINSNDFYEFKLVECDEFYNYFIDLHKDERFTDINFKALPKVLKLRKKKDRWDEEIEIEDKDSPEEAIYRIEYNSWLNRKDIYFPLFKLHKNSINKIIEKLNSMKE